VILKISDMLLRSQSVLSNVMEAKHACAPGTTSVSQRQRGALSATLSTTSVRSDPGGSVFYSASLITFSAFHCVCVGVFGVESTPKHFDAPKVSTGLESGFLLFSC
jgi:hypothetical protein